MQLQRIAYVTLQCARVLPLLKYVLNLQKMESEQDEPVTPGIRSSLWYEERPDEKTSDDRDSRAALTAKITWLFCQLAFTFLCTRGYIFKKPAKNN